MLAADIKETDLLHADNAVAHTAEVERWGELARVVSKVCTTYRNMRSEAHSASART
jgi:hypothetical protein